MESRNNSVVEGKAAIKARFEGSPANPNVTLEWVLDFVDLAESGELAYTYGPYTYSVTDFIRKYLEKYWHIPYSMETTTRW